MTVIARVLLVSVMALSCSGAQRGGSQCRSRASLHCLTAVECDVDRVLGCEVCRCSDAPYVSPAGPR